MRQRSVTVDISVVRDGEDIDLRVSVDRDGWLEVEPDVALTDSEKRRALSEIAEAEEDRRAEAREMWCDL